MIIWLNHWTHISYYVSLFWATFSYKIYVSYPILICTYSRFNKSMSNSLPNHSSSWVLHINQCQLFCQKVFNNISFLLPHSLFLTISEHWLTLLLELFLLARITVAIYYQYTILFSKAHLLWFAEYCSLLSVCYTLVILPSHEATRTPFLLLFHRTPTLPEASKRGDYLMFSLIKASWICFCILPTS